MKSDKGFDESEKLLNQLEKDIHKEYAQAAKEMTEKVESYFAKFAAQDEAQRELYEQGKITKKEYGEWRQRKMLTGKQYTDMRDTLAKDLTNTDKIAMSYTRNGAIDTYALNMNYETYNIENDLKVDTSFALYNHDAVERLIKDKPDLLPQPSVDVAEDMKWNMQHLQSAITQGILQGESIPKVAARMMRVAAMDDRAAIRNARTAMTGAQNGGRLDAMERAKERGVDVKKGWMATLDDRTRDSHVELDGEEKEIDEEFSNGLMFPGDADGEPAEVYNCRCRMIHVYPKHPVDWSDLDNRNTDNLGDMTYEEWKEAHGAKKEDAKESEEIIIENDLVKPERPEIPQMEDYDNEADYDKAMEEYEEKRQEYREQRKIYVDKKDELAEKWLGGERKYKSADDVKAWAKDRNVKLENNVENIVDSRLFDDVLGTLDEMFERFPEAKKRLDDASFFGLDIDTKGDYFMEANGGLRLSGIFQYGKETYTSVIDMQAEGFTTRGAGDLATLVRHEYGHNMDSYLRSKFSTIDSDYSWKASGKLDRRYEASRNYDKELIEITLKHGSEYARTNTLEAFAEGFAEYTSNPNSEYAKAFGEFFERWYNANPIE